MATSTDRVSLVVTILNEITTIDALLESVVEQTRPADEVVVVDGGSTDGSWERLHEWARSGRLPLRVFQERGATIARGRNLAIERAGGELIAVTDAGVRLDPDWLARLLAGLRPGVNVVAGFFAPDAHGVFEHALGATTLPARSDVRAESFLPSSRSVLFRRAAWQAVGGYPEWLDYCEDVVFDLALQQFDPNSGRPFAFAPDALVWFRPRPSLAAFFRQYYRYARGDGKADLWRRRHAVRYATYVGVLVLLRGVARHPWRNLMLLLAGGLLYTRRPYQRLWPALRGWRPSEMACAVILVPVIRLVGDVAKMLGYLVGVAWRLRHRGGWELGFRSWGSQIPKPNS